MCRGLLRRIYRRHFILLEDLGDIDLWSERFLPWEERRDYYFQVLTQIYRLHSFDLKINSRGFTIVAKVTAHDSINGSMIIFWKILLGKFAR